MQVPSFVEIARAVVLRRAIVRRLVSLYKMRYCQSQIRRGAYHAAFRDPGQARAVRLGA